MVRGVSMNEQDQELRDDIKSDLKIEIAILKQNLDYIKNQIIVFDEMQKLIEQTDLDYNMYDISSSLGIAKDNIMKLLKKKQKNLIEWEKYDVL
jgi:hypothetical protein